MISVVMRGGLGNQLFMVCTALALAARTGQRAVFEDAASYAERPAYWSTVFSTLPRIAALPPLTEVHEAGLFRYTPLAGTDLLLRGYFQSYLYFTEFDVRPWLTLPVQPPRKATSVHFRRGDYKVYPELYPLLAVDYYRAALATVAPTTVLFFCEEPDWDEVAPMVAVLQAEFHVPFERAAPMNEIEHLALMRSCTSHVIANSTFSWWGAYLADSECVCYPAIWLYGLDSTQLCPPHWHCIA